jgi:hypothetical protein
VLADPQGGQARYDLLKGMAFLHAVTRRWTAWGMKRRRSAFATWITDPTLYTTVLARKDELVLQVRVPAAAWKGADTVAAARAVAEAFAGQPVRHGTPPCRTRSGSRWRTP